MVQHNILHTIRTIEPIGRFPRSMVRKLQPTQGTSQIRSDYFISYTAYYDEAHPYYPSPRPGTISAIHHQRTFFFPQKSSDIPAERGLFPLSLPNSAFPRVSVFFPAFFLSPAGRFFPAARIRLYHGEPNRAGGEPSRGSSVSRENRFIGAGVFGDGTAGKLAVAAG